MSVEQLGLIMRHFRGRQIVIMLDSDAVENATKIRDQIRQSRTLAGDTASVAIGVMPSGRKDPGECTPTEIKAAVVTAINEPTR
jgi:hypothetical protein